MKRAGKAWRALGRARQIALVLLGALSLVQVVALIFAGQLWLLPAVVIVFLLGAVLIKMSTLTRVTVPRPSGNETRPARNVEGGSSLALLREQIGRTGGQFVWLGERTLEVKAVADDLVRDTQELLARTELLMAQSDSALGADAARLVHSIDALEHGVTSDD